MMAFTKYFIGFLAAALAVAQAVADDLDTLAEDILIVEGVPGMAVAIVRPGTTPIIRSYGVREVATQEPVNDHTVFGIASATKAFTALSIAMLIDDGALSWNDRVREHLPGFQVADPYVSEHATVKDLIAHRTGAVKGDLVWFANPDAAGSALVDRLDALPQQQSFRAGFSYSNLMYVVAGELVRKKSGRTWRDFIETKIFDPLGMKNAIVDRHALFEHENAAGLHAFDGTSVRQFPASRIDDNTAPAGGIYASVGDLSKWLQFWLSHSDEDAPSGMLERARYREMTSFQTLISERSPIDDFMHDADAPYGYALGWFVGHYRGGKTLTHLGGGDGVAALVSWMPEEGIGVAVLMNMEGALGRIAIRNAVFDETLGVKDKDWAAEFRALHAQYRDVLQKRAEASGNELASKRSAGPCLPLHAYAGTYEGGTYGNVSIRQDGSGLKATFGGQRTHRLTHRGGDVFQVRFDNPAFSWPTPALFRFTVEGAGAPSALTFDVAGQSATYMRSEP